MSSIPSKLSDPDKRVILELLKSTHSQLTVDAIFGKAAVKQGENFMSVVTRVSVFGHDLDTGDKVTLSLIMKRLPESAERRELFLCDAAFQNEANFYSVVAPGLGVGRGSKLPFPPCLQASDDVMVLRDLRQDGFTMADRRTGLDLDHCSLAMQELGKYHALSYAMKHLQPDEFHMLSSSVKEVFIHKGNTLLIGCIDHSFEMALKAFKGGETAVVRKLKNFLGKGIDLLTPHVVPGEPLAVICHGDFHSNNILFKYANNNNTPTEVAFLDLQGCRYASPALDILYFIFSSSSSNVLKFNFKTLMSSYHQSLETTIKHLAPSAKVSSFEDFMNEVRKRLDYGLIMSLMMLPLVSADKVTFDLDKVSHETLSEVQQDVESTMVNDEYNRRVNCLLTVTSEEKLLSCFS